MLSGIVNIVYVFVFFVFFFLGCLIVWGLPVT